MIADLQFIDVGHKKHLDSCTGSRKRQQGEREGHVEIEGLDELEGEEDASLAGPDDDEGADVMPAKASNPEAPELIMSFA